jgi:hypothetical protein
MSPWFVWTVDERAYAGVDAKLFDNPAFYLRLTSPIVFVARDTPAMSSAGTPCAKCGSRMP